MPSGTYMIYMRSEGRSGTSKAVLVHRSVPAYRFTVIFANIHRGPGASAPGPFSRVRKIMLDPRDLFYRYMAFRVLKLMVSLAITSGCWIRYWVPGSGPFKLSQMTVRQ